MQYADSVIDNTVLFKAIKEGRQQHTVIYTLTDAEKGISCAEKIKQYGYEHRLDVDKWTMNNYFTVPHAVIHESRRSCTLIFFAKRLTKDEWLSSCLEYFIENLQQHSFAL